MTRISTSSVLLIASCALASGACREDYPPFARLDSLRVLAIQSEPVSPGAGETTLLTPLVYAPEGQTVSYAWSWCALAGSANEGYPCLLQEGQIPQMQGEAIVVPPFDLGNGPTASFAVTFDPERLRPFCRSNTLPPAAPPNPDGGVAEVTPDGGAAGMAPDGGGGDTADNPFALDCTNGFPIQIKLTVSTAQDRVETVRTLTLKLEGAQTPNTNPAIEGLVASFRRPGGLPNDTFDVPFGPDAVSLPRQKQTTIKALVNAAQSEPFIDRDEMDKPFASNERLFLTWLVESGKTSPERTSYLPLRVPLADAVQSKWTPASVEDYPGTVSKVYVVIRDNRGGVGWTTASARLVEAARE